MTVSAFAKWMKDLPETDGIMPVMFAGHGNPMNAIEDNEFSRTWKRIGRELAPPRAILCISAHWETRGTKVTAMEKPKTIHDFGGFPQALFDAQYPAPGSPELAEETIGLIKKGHAEKDFEWGLDHGTWSVLLPMFPAASIPVVQLSLDYTLNPLAHYELAKEISELRKKGVLIVGSGNIVHNLGMVQWRGGAYDWAVEFDAKVRELIEKGDHLSLVDYGKLGRSAQLSIPTNEHYLPLLYILGLRKENESLKWFNETVGMGSVSMRSLILG